MGSEIFLTITDRAIKSFSQAHAGCGWVMEFF